MKPLIILFLVITLMAITMKGHPYLFNEECEKNGIIKLLQCN